MNNVNIELLPHQLEIVQSKARYRALMGGAGSGKSALAVRFLLIRAIMLPGILHVCVSPTHSMSSSNITPLLLDLVATAFDPPLIEGKDFVYNSSSHTLKIKKFNAKIRLLSADNPVSLKGFSCATVVMDEVDSQTLIAFQEADRGVRDPKANGDLVTLLVGTYEGDTGWVYDFTEGDKKLPGIHFKRATTYDNTFLDPSYVENRLLTLDSRLAASYIYGNHVSFVGTSAAHNFSDENIRDVEFDPKQPTIIVGMDFNVSPNTACFMQEQFINGLRCVCVFDEYWETGTTAAKAEECIVRYPNVRHEIFPDASSQYGVKRITDATDYTIVENVYARNNMKFFIHVDKANPLRQNRINSLTSLIRNAKGQIRFYINPRCVNTIKDLKRCTREGVLNGRHSDKDRGHAFDSLTYPLEKRYPVLLSNNKSNTRTSKFDL